MVWRQLLFVVTLSLFAASLPLQAYAGLGVSPAGVFVKSALNDISQQHRVKIIRDFDLDKEAVINVEYRGVNAQFLDGPDELFLPVGVDRVDFEFSLIPSQLPNGDYGAQVVFLPSVRNIEDVSGQSGATVAVRAGTTLGVHFTVSDEQVVSFTLGEVLVRSIEEGMDLLVTFPVFNSGNVSWRPDEVRIIIRDSAGEIVFTDTVFGGEIEFVSPGDVTERSLLINAGLIPGSYTLESESFYGGNSISVSETGFTVFPRGTLPQRGDFISISTNKDSFAVGENAKIVGVFKNTGEISYEASMIIEVFLEGELVDLIVTDPQRIEITEQTEFNVVTVFDKAGVYTLNAYIEFGQKTTPSLSKEITVIGADISTLYLILALLVGLMILGATIFTLRKRRIAKKKKKDDGTLPPPAPPLPPAVPVAPVPVQPPVPPPTPPPVPAPPAVPPQTPVIGKPQGNTPTSQPPQNEPSKDEEGDDLWTISL